jgi:hypothetical protein
LSTVDDPLPAALRSPDAIAPKLLNTAEDRLLTLARVTSRRRAWILSQFAPTSTKPFRQPGGVFRTGSASFLAMIGRGEFTRMDATNVSVTFRVSDICLRASA